VIESELFGHERGSFTGASHERKGKFEEADGGTIFLDEIGDLEPTAQVKLLRALEQGEIQRVGSDRPRRVEVRMIAATNRCLETEVEEGRFREDLFYRVSVCPLTLPPLRERRDEIPILLDYFLQEAAAKMGRRVPAIDRELRSFIYSVYEFPGNIRELRNLARFIACVGDEHPVRLRDLPERYRRAREGTEGAEEAEGASWRETVVREAEKAYWTDLLRRHQGRVKRLCDETGLSRSRVYEILSEYSLKPGSFR
jgi:transcriptional regulator with PAS, ATPase and Fis domain